ncbi:helix-hairpin-helix domain-containing protein [Thermus aquaticus]|uniref:DNA binding protein n=1 Tax=Thermus aquaticus (strain ATCC BAA-2747 / Y51MC23) TaxID=498848 RepID=A0ABN4IEY3_THEA5|nr:helix-hairpin-helix domain-containing protein [Thermus aquaticus]ALJ90055.1 putative DNA binding protein [Thermus aquaticus Y51MC23]
MGRRRSYIGVLAGRVGETQNQQPAAPAPATPLPPGFPGASALLAAGYTTLESLRGLSEADLIAIRGIGPRLAKQILQALEAE